MIDYDKEIVSGLDLLIDSWSIEDIEDMSVFSEGIKTGLEIARNYILANMKGIEDD